MYSNDYSSTILNSLKLKKKQKTEKQPKCSRIEKTKKYTDTMKYYTGMKMIKLQLHATTGMILKNKKLS